MAVVILNGIYNIRKVCKKIDLLFSYTRILGCKKCVLYVDCEMQGDSLIMKLHKQSDGIWSGVVVCSSGMEYKLEDVIMRVIREGKWEIGKDDEGEKFVYMRYKMESLGLTSE